uniref:latent-transforming growth factor beta-binding protein 2-like isoform X3 n=1 Tax=Ciona intestinalis TaxID=7719 RepID=UPI000EF50C22|nr:latent-transforming growth factor beta-binding protein 2-like isoform X3 [Ciona intestinalis]|eukprot:XP_026696685.1 latent-transforming growth factor beta-binding protein 2-like isoform X3 [Ciona intestinalis]
MPNILQLMFKAKVRFNMLTIQSNNNIIFAVVLGFTINIDTGVAIENYRPIFAYENITLAQEGSRKLTNGTGVIVYKKPGRCLSEKPCNLNQTCEDTSVNNYTCNCQPGFEMKSSKCQDIDECTRNPCNNQSSTCTNTVGNYSCICRNGYENKDNICQDKNECDFAYDYCDLQSTCTNTNGSFYCECDPGFHGNGTVCTKEMLTYELAEKIAYATLIIHGVYALMLGFVFMSYYCPNIVTTTFWKFWD